MPDHPAPGLVLSPTASVGRDVSFGANVVVHDGVVIGDGVVVQDNVVLGKPPRLAPTSGAPRDRARRRSSSRTGAAVCAGAIVFAGAHIGAGAIVGDQSYVRERARVGANSVVGRGSAVDNDVVIGARVSVQTNVYVTGFSVVEDDVFLGPGVADDQRRRHGPPRRPTTQLRGAMLRRACRIGGAAVLVPGVEVGEEAFVAAGAVVTNDVPARARRHGRPGARHPPRRRRGPAGSLDSEAAAPTGRARAGAGAPPAAARRAPHALAIAVAALLTGGAVAVTEVGRVWRRGSAPLPTEAVGEPDSEAAARLAAAGAEALGQTVEVAVRGYQEGSTRENALLNLLGSFTLAWAVIAARRRTPSAAAGASARSATSSSAGHHIHHFVPGHRCSPSLAGGASVVARSERARSAGWRSPSAPAWR